MRHALMVRTRGLLLPALLACAWGFYAAGQSASRIPGFGPPPGAAVPAAAPAAAEPIDTSELFFPGDGGLSAFPGATFAGDRGCSPSALLSFLNVARQVVPVEELRNYAVRVLQTPSNSPTSVPDSVLWLDLQTGVIVTGVPKLNWLQQTQVFNYTLLVPGLVDFAAYNTALASLSQLVSGLAYGSAAQPPARYACATANPRLEPLAEWLEQLRAAHANASEVDGGLKKGIEYRVPAGCTVELNALYTGEPLGPPANLSQAAGGRQPTENNCCRLCRDTAGCNAFVFCPSFSGCTANTSASAAPFPAFGCQLQRVSGLSSDPAAFPPAAARGPPVAFRSGRLA